MSILDWFKQPTCAELAPLVVALKDPLAYLDSDGTAGGDSGYFPPVTTMGAVGVVPNYVNVDYSVHDGWPSPFRADGEFDAALRDDPTARLPYRRPVSRALLVNASEIDTATRLLQVYYATPNALRLCPIAQGWYHARGRVRALDAIGAYGKLRGFDAATTPAVTGVLLKVFDNAAGSKTGSRETEVVYAAAQIVLDARTSSLDAATWLPLWRWALGGPNGNASVRTRVMAMKAIQAVIRRGALLPRQVLAAATMADVLQQLVAGRAPSVAAAERAFFLSEADATVGAVNFALTQAALAEGKPPAWRPPLSSVASRRVAWWIAGAAAVAATAVGGVAVYRRAHG